MMQYISLFVICFTVTINISMICNTIEKFADKRKDDNSEGGK